jgi:protein phosphatase
VAQRDDLPRHGCVSGRLTAPVARARARLRARRAVYFASSKPFLDPSTAPPVSAQQAQDDLLDADDVLAKRRVTTRLAGPVTIRAENAAAALEVMSRFAVHPKWLVYLPPTMSPVETSARPDALERPEEAFTYFREEGVDRVVCEEKHMGSRAVLLIARDAEAARRRFGVTDGAAGVCLTRTGRRSERPGPRDGARRRVRARCRRRPLRRARHRLGRDRRRALPWSAKALALLRTQYAPVGAAARHARPPRTMPPRARPRVCPRPRPRRLRGAPGPANRYVDAYRRYCWDVEARRRASPLHLLATEGGCHVGRTTSGTFAPLASRGGRPGPPRHAPPRSGHDGRGEPRGRRRVVGGVTAAGGEGWWSALGLSPRVAADSRSPP